MFRTAIARQARLFSTSPIVRKSPVETVKDAAKAVDRKVSDAAVKGIETGGTQHQTLSQLYHDTTSTSTLIITRTRHVKRHGIIARPS